MTFVSAAILLFLVMDPLGNILLFVAALQNVAPERRARVAELEARIAEMQAMAKTLHALVDACCGDGRPECPILDDLAEGVV